MKILQIVFICLVTYTSCKGDTIPDLIIPFSANWDVGDKIKYKVTKTKEDIKFGYSHGKYETTQVGVLEIMDKTDNAYELEWKIIETIYPEGIEMDTFYTRIYEEMMKAFSIRYTTDIEGQFKDLINWEDILNFQFEIMDNIAEIIEEEEGMNVEEIKMMFNQMFSSKEQVEAMFIQEIKLLHSFYGEIFQSKKTTPKQKSIPNIFGGEDVLVNALIKIEKLDTEASIIVGYDSFELDENTKNEMLSNYIESIEQKFGKGNVDTESVENIKMEINDNTLFDLDYSKGVANVVSFTRNVVVKSENQDLKRIKEIIIERIE